MDTCLLAGTTCLWTSPLDGKDGEGVAMVERTTRCRYPSVPPHQGESDAVNFIADVLNRGIPHQSSPNSPRTAFDTVIVAYKNAKTKINI